MSIEPSKMPGPGDRATWPSIIMSHNDPDFKEWEVICESCNGTGLEPEEDWDEDGAEILCFTCDGEGKHMVSNLGLRRKR